MIYERKNGASGSAGRGFYFDYFMRQGGGEICRTVPERMIAGRNQSKEQVQTKEQMQSEKQLQGEEQVWTGKQTQTDGKLESVGEVQTGVEQIGKTIQKTTQSDELGKVYDNTQTDKAVTNQDTRPRVALTFDDGPNGKYTPALLEGLKERGVHATFFSWEKILREKKNW